MNSPRKPINSSPVKDIRDSRGRLVARVNVKTGEVAVRQRGETVRFSVPAKSG